MLVAYPLNTIQNSHFRFRDVLSSKSWEDAQNHDQASEEEVKVDKRIGQVKKQVNWQLLISFVIVELSLGAVLWKDAQAGWEREWRPLPPPQNRALSKLRRT